MERMAAVLQGVISNYETDLFTPLIKRAAELTGTSLKKELDKEARTKSAASLRVIADHSRAATFLISDGVIPANEGRGYVLRKIIRRAITHGRLLGQTKPFLHEMVSAVRDLMQDAYPELNETADRVSKAILVEETRFEKTIHQGLGLLEDYIDDVVSGSEDVSLSRNEPARAQELPPYVSVSRRQSRQAQESDSQGLESFRLCYDTFGLPLDALKTIVRDLGIQLGSESFDRCNGGPESTCPCLLERRGQADG